MNEIERLAQLRKWSLHVELESRERFPFLRRFKLNESVEPGSYNERLVQAGFPVPKFIYISFVVIVSAGIGYLCSFLGKILAVYSSVLFAYYFLFPFLDERAYKRRRQVVPHLPGFLEGFMAALSTGFSVEGAVVQAARTVPDGLLKKELEPVVRAVNSGVLVGDALGKLTRKIAGREVLSLVTAISLFAGVGGRMLDPFQRLVEKMREQQSSMDKALRDLVQVKQAFIILMSLSVIVPLLLVVIEPSYLNGAYHDPHGRLILQIGVILIMTALFVFRRIINLKV